MSRRNIVAPFLVALVVSHPALASACTVCDSDLGRQVRGGVFNADFAATTLAVIAPFPLFLLAVGLVRFAVPKLLAPRVSQPTDKNS